MSGKRYGLGIDTGGTYTDAVIVDMDDTNVISKGKSRTTHHDLSIGLMEATGKVFESCEITPMEISLVGISTTLATNSILEGHGGEVGLIIIGWDPTEEMHFGEKNLVHICGGYYPDGKAKASLSEVEVCRAVKEVSQGVDAIAVSGLFSVANASQERTVKKIAREMTGLPVVAGHELSSELGIAERTETAVLNGKLIPKVNEFFDDLEEAFHRLGTKAPIMIYKGDGSVMSLNVARERPVETILSGPAASAMGAKALAKLEDCIVIDIGGTSTDIAILESGFPMIKHEGAKVGSWRTRVKAVDMMTVALGGDSHVRFERQVLKIGPERVVPLCILPGNSALRDRILRSGVSQFYMVEESNHSSLSPNEKRIFDVLIGNGPMTLNEIRDRTEGLWVIEPYLSSMCHKGVVTSSALTPTDVLHYQGKLEIGDKEMAEIGVKAMAEHMAMEPDQLATMVMEEVRRMVSSSLTQKLLQDEFGDWQQDCEQCARIIDKATKPLRDGIFRLEPRCTVPIVGVGAPACYFMDDLADRMGADVLFPEHHDVGNAVGAVCSKITDSLSATVTPTINFTYLAEVPFIGPMEYAHFDSAMESCKSSITRHLKKRIEASGGRNPQFFYKVKIHRAVEGGWGAWNKEASRGMNFAEITVRVVADPPMPEYQN